MDESEEAEVDHVPRGAVFVLHQIQRHGNMRVTVVTAQVMLRETNKQITPVVIILYKVNMKSCSYHPVFVLL